MAKNTKGTAAAQEVAAPATQTAAVGTNTAPVTTFRIAKKNPPKVRVAKEKVEKEPKRLTGTLAMIAMVSYNHWRQFVNVGINGEDESVMPLATFRKAEGALKHKTKDGQIVDTKWGGYIAVKPENVEVVSTMLNNFVASQSELPEAERAVSMWQMLETPFNVTPERKPRAKKETAEATAEVAAETAETAEVAEA
jgi:hypothetical protein